jgi:PKD repeat protein
MLKDSPYSDAKALLVTFSEVSAHVSGAGGFTVLPFTGGATSRTCDLKKLTNAQDVLGTGTLAAGHYTQVRLVVTSAVLYFDNPSAGTAACAASIPVPAGNSAQINVSSGDVKLNREFDVTSSGATTILVDFDGDQSVHAQGNGQYNMTPVISVVSVQ